MLALLVLAMVLWTTGRHEASHALAAWLEGVPVREMKLLPGIHPDAGFYFGNVIYQGDTSRVVRAAPYVVDGLLLLGVAGLTTTIRGWRRYRLPILLFGVVSPLVDLVYSYQVGMWRSSTDVADLSGTLPPVTVHLYFLATIALAILLFRRLRAAGMH